MAETATKARVPLVARGDVPADELASYDHIATSRGRDPEEMPNVFRALANSGGALERVAGVGEFVRFGTDFDDQLRELVILTVAQENRCAYEWTHHFHLAERLGLSAEVLGSIGTPAIEATEGIVGAATKYARLVARGEPVDDATVSALAAEFGSGGLVDLTVLVGHYASLARFINTMQVPLEEGTEARPFNV